MSTFDAQAFLDSAGVAREIVTYRRSETIFSQGEAGDSVIHIQKGGVKLSVVSDTDREVIVAMLGAGDFCGEGGWRASRPEWRPRRRSRRPRRS